MVRLYKNGEVFVKLLYWGCAGSGKTTAVDSLYRLCKEKYNDAVEPTGTLTKIAMASGSTLYFDRGIFQSKKENKVFYHVYTTAGQARFSPLRKKIFTGTDGVILMFDAQRSRLEDNIQALKELKNVSEGKLISDIPLLVMVNKQDLPDTMKKREVEEILKQENLFYPPSHPLHMWNPIVYESIALYENAMNVYQVFSELARRTAIYQAIGDGKAPDTSKPVKLSKNVPEL
ncbi:MAG: ADP-ribosylation factor-like protein [Promethearchaeota archaeon]